MFVRSRTRAFANWGLVDEQERRTPTCRFDVRLVDCAEPVCDAQGSVVLRMDADMRALQPHQAAEAPGVSLRALGDTFSLTTTFPIVRCYACNT
jgi:hypothetical protein